MYFHKTEMNKIIESTILKNCINTLIKNIFKETDVTFQIKMLNSTEMFTWAQTEFCDTCFTNTYKIISVNYFGTNNFTPVKYENLASEVYKGIFGSERQIPEFQLMGL